MRSLEIQLNFKKQCAFAANPNERPQFASSNLVLGLGHCSCTKTNQNGERGDVESDIKTEDD